MLGVVPFLVLQNQTGVYTFLYLSLNLVSLLFRSRIGSPPNLIAHELGVHLEVLACHKTLGAVVHRTPPNRSL